MVIVIMQSVHNPRRGEAGNCSAAQNACTDFPCCSRTALLGLCGGQGWVCVLRLFPWIRIPVCGVSSRRLVRVLLTRSRGLRRSRSLTLGCRVFWATLALPHVRLVPSWLWLGCARCSLKCIRIGAVIANRSRCISSRPLLSPKEWLSGFNIFLLRVSRGCICRDTSSLIIIHSRHSCICGSTRTWSFTRR
ncbi:hypothetical protein BDV12DRAFT_174457 [Aspergillus spectabilis]